MWVQVATMLSEREKYLSLYNGTMAKLLKYDYQYCDRQQGGYGRNRWGFGAINFLIWNRADSICDIGCGYGYFCNLCTTFINKVYGVDIASVETGNVVNNRQIEFISADARNLPIPDGAVEWTTSFDCLEHIPEEGIDQALSEMRRIATVGMIVTISTEPCGMYTEILHNIVKPIEWWHEKLRKYGIPQRIGRDPYRQEPYILVRFLSK
jgi:ubiquinone/menaquinone biosynthesis C-methylase UbiE